MARWTLEVPGREPVRIEMPVHIDRQLPTKEIRYRLVAHVRLDERLVGHDLDLVIAYLPASASLRVDGHRARELGESAMSAAYGDRKPHRWVIPANDTKKGELTLQLDVVHRWTHSAWLDAVPVIVRAGETTPTVTRNRLVNEQGGWFGLVALSEMGLTFLAVYFWDRRRRAYLWFAIQGLSASYYPAYVLGLPLMFIGLKFANLFLAWSLSFATIISIYFTYDFFNLGKPSRFWLILLLASLVPPLFAVAPAFASNHPFVDVSYSAPLVVFCVALAVTYQIFMGVRLVHSYPDRSTALFFLLCWIALGASSWVDLWAWIGGGEVFDGARPACIGLGLFGIFQAMLLSRRHFRSLMEADRLNDRLRTQLRSIEERQAEIESLNDELRQQIGRRSAQILSALTNSETFTGKILLEPGSIVQDRYRVLRPIGKGGMGTVYEVERIHDGRHFALKVAQEVRGLAMARLAREAHIATRIHDPHIVSIVDADVAETGYMYLVLELVDGISLADCKGEHGPAWHLSVLLQILEGVRALHAQGIIHRDLKPENVLLSGNVDEDPYVKITDFGISRWVSDSSEPPEGLLGHTEAATVHMRKGTGESLEPPAEHKATDSHPATHSTTSPSNPQLTQADSIAGTPLYVAPELADGSALNPAVDVFSFGVVAYRTLTGKPPHAEPPLLARLAGREPRAQEPIKHRCVWLSDDTAATLDACLSFDPDKRPSIDQLLRVLRGDLLRSGMSGWVERRRKRREA